jgi:hypothetical protein
MKTIAAVPESITRQQYIELIESLGFNPNDLRHMAFGLGGIFAEVVSRDENGKLMHGAPNEIATHTIHIPIVDRPAPADWNAPGQTVTAPTDLR